jgi:hypothetical protein
MTVKQLVRKLQNPPCDRIAAVRIEFAGGRYLPGLAGHALCATSSEKKSGTLNRTARESVKDRQTNNRRLAEIEQAVGCDILENVHCLISKAAKKDIALLWALRRYVYAARPSACGPHGAHCFKAAAQNIALSLFRPRWIDAFKLTCHKGRPVTSTLAAGLRAC